MQCSALSQNSLKQPCSRPCWWHVHPAGHYHHIHRCSDQKPVERGHLYWRKLSWAVTDIQKKDPVACTCLMINSNNESSVILTVGAEINSLQKNETMPSLCWAKSRGLSSFADENCYIVGCIHWSTPHSEWCSHINVSPFLIVEDPHCLMMNCYHVPPFWCETNHISPSLVVTIPKIHLWWWTFPRISLDKGPASDPPHKVAALAGETFGQSGARAGRSFAAPEIRQVSFQSVFIVAKSEKPERWKFTGNPPIKIEW